MALEDLTKKDLVGIARKLDQENKELKNRLDKAGVSGEDLPYNAVSVVEANDKHYCVKIKFDLESGVASVVERIEFERNMKHMAEYRAKEFFAQISRIDTRR